MLIEEIHVYPILWNKQISDYEGNDKKKIVWATIAAKLQVTGIFYSIPIFRS